MIGANGPPPRLHSVSIPNIPCKPSSTILYTSGSVRQRMLPGNAGVVGLGGARGGRPPGLGDERPFVLFIDTGGEVAEASGFGGSRG